MRASRRWESLLVSAVLAVAYGGCARCSKSDDTVTTIKPSADAAVARDSSVAPEPIESLHFIGRFDTRDPAHPICAYPGSTISARFTGTGIDVALGDQGRNWFDVIIDDGAPIAISTAGRTKITLAKDLAPGTHDVVMIKRTEAYAGWVRFDGFTPKDGEIVPSPFPYTRRIEMIGDSITCGYGNLGTLGCSFSVDTESENAAWGALASKELQAAHTAIAISGRGMWRNSDGSTKLTMPEAWTLAVPDDPTSLWDFARFTPDVVVINLGTNDYAYGDPGLPYQLAYAAFLQKLRATYPAAPIVAALGPMLPAHAQATLAKYVQNAIASTGDPKVTLLELEPQDGSDGFGCDSHPNVARQRKMAAALVAHLKKQLGW